jgi:hypothetical protein
MTTFLRSIAMALSLALAVAACGGSAPPRSATPESCGTTTQCIDQLAAALEKLTPSELDSLGKAIREELTAAAAQPQEVNGVQIGGSGLQGDLERLAKTFPDGLSDAIAAVDRLRGSANPVASGIGLLFIAAALIFTPGAFRSVGGTMFGEDGIIAAIEGIESLK